MIINHYQPAPLNQSANHQQLHPSYQTSLKQSNNASHITSRSERKAIDDQEQLQENMFKEEVLKLYLTQKQTALNHINQEITLPSPAITLNGKNRPTVYISQAVRNRDQMDIQRILVEQKDEQQSQIAGQFLRELLYNRSSDPKTPTFKKEYDQNKMHSPLIKKTQSFDEQPGEGKNRLIECLDSSCKIDVNSSNSFQGSVNDSNSLNLNYNAGLYSKRPLNSQITHAISIAFIPHTLFQKFSRKAATQPAANLSKPEHQESYGAVHRQQELQYDLNDKKAYVKLLKIKQIRDKDESLHLRCEDLRRKNEQIMMENVKKDAQVLIIKNTIQKDKAQFEVKEQEFKSIISHLNQVIDQLRVEVLKKQKSNVNYLTLNEQLAKEINDLKIKNKSFVKILQSIKYDMNEKEMSRQESVVHSQMNGPLKGAAQHRQPGNRVDKHADMSHFLTLQRNQYGIDKSYIMDNHKTNNILAKQSLLNTYKSHQNLHTEAPPLHRKSNNEIEIKSQKSLGIRKNGQSPKASQVLHNANGSSSVTMFEDKKRGNQSQSNFSNNSNKSLVQKVGFVRKSPNVGSFYDYMIQDVVVVQRKGCQKRGVLQKKGWQIGGRNHIQI